MAAWLETFGNLAGMAIAFPLAGMIMMVAGWTVGQICMDPSASPFHKYGLLSALGYFTWLIATGQLGGPSDY